MNMIKSRRLPNTLAGTVCQAANRCLSLQGSFKVIPSGCCCQIVGPANITQKEFEMFLYGCLAGMRAEQKRQWQESYEEAVLP